MADLLPPRDAAALVGRERELATLRGELDAACAGHGGLVLISGEAGIGKTALAETLCRDVEQRGVRVLVGRSYDLAETPPYGPWVDLFARYRPGDALPPLPSAFARRGTVGDVTSAAGLARDVCDFLAALAASGPLLLLLDDLHWADPASLDLLRAVSHTLAEHPILLLATYRAEELHRDHPLSALLPALVREAPATRLDLRALTRDAVHALVEARAPLHKAETDRLADYLMRHAEGNPFFSGELLRALIEAGTLRREGAGWLLDDLARVPVPPLVRQVIDGRVARLGAEAARLLAVAAVIGQEVPLALWARAAEVDEEALLGAVERGVAAHLLDETPDGTAARFVHALIREALYEGMLAARRRRLHLRAAEELVAQGDADPDAVASHFRRAGDERAVEWLIAAAERALRARAWPTAAERFEAALAAMGGNRAGEERAWLLLRISHLLFLSHLFGGQSADKPVSYADEASALAAALKDAGLAAYARGHRAWIDVATGDPAHGVPELRASLAALQALAPDAAARLAIRAAPIAATGGDWRGRMALWCAFTGRFRDALAFSEVGRAGIAGTDGAAAAAGGSVGHDAEGMARAFLGMPEEAATCFAVARTAARRVNNQEDLSNAAGREVEYVMLPYRTDDVAGRHRLIGTAEEAAARAIRAEPILAGQIAPRTVHLPLLVLEGRWDEAERMRPDEGIHGNDARGRRSALERHLLPLAYWKGDAERAWSAVREALPLGVGTEPGTARRFANAVAAQRIAALLSLDAGDCDTARQWLEAHDRWLAWSGAVLGLSESHALWARYYRQLGDGEAARDHAERALAHASDPRQPLALLAAHRLLGELDADAGRFRDSARHLEASLQLADACHAPYERALTLLAMAERCTAASERDEATRLLGEVRTIYEPLGAKPALARVGALGERLARTAAPVPPYPDGLTAREVEVLRLIAAGKSNREIAAALFISERTVNRHMTNLYTKIDAHSKADATAYALRNRLA